MATIKILLIAEQEKDYKLVDNFLGEIPGEQFRLTRVSSYEVGLKAIRDAEFDVCLLDYQIGSKTGLDFLHELCAPECDIPVIVLSESSDPDIDFAAMKAGASDFISKSELSCGRLERSIRYAAQLKQTAAQRIRLTHETQSRQAAEAANRAKDEFIALISHEIRTPLNAVLGWVKLMRSGKLDATAFARGLEAIENSSRSQAKLIEDLMDYSRVTSGNFKFTLSTFNPAQAIQTAVSLVHPVCEQKQVSLKVNLDENPGEIHADSERIQQVLNNLLGNALKFTPTGGIVEITLQSNPEEIIIIVQDNGDGMPQDLLPYIFDRYRQSDIDAPRKQRGIGLGLPISRYIVEAHGGVISASSDGVGKGARFTLKLPRQKPPCEPA